MLMKYIFIPRMISSQDETFIITIGSQKQKLFNIQSNIFRYVFILKVGKKRKINKNITNQV